MIKRLSKLVKGLDSLFAFLNGNAFQLSCLE